MKPEPRWRTTSSRQLNDDLHDWADDLATGHVSPVVAYLLDACAIAPGRHRLGPLTAVLKRRFWQDGLVAISDKALAHIRAVRTLETAGLLRTDSDFMREIIDPIERSLQKGKRLHTQGKSFLRAYAGHPA